MDNRSKLIISATAAFVLVALLIFMALRAAIWAGAKDINKNLDLMIDQKLDDVNESLKEFSDNAMRVAIGPGTIKLMNGRREEMFEELKAEFNKYKQNIVDKERNEIVNANKEKRREMQEKHRKIGEKYGVIRNSGANLASSSANLNRSAEELNRRTSEEKSPIHQGLSALDSALKWPVLDFVAKRTFIKAMHGQMKDILSDLKKIGGLNANNDAERFGLVKSFYKINAKLAVIKFALEVAQDRDFANDITSSKKLKNSMNEIYADLIAKGMPYRMQMIDESGNLKKDSDEKFLPVFADQNLKLKDHEEKKALLTASTFEEVHELNSKFSKSSK